jgi:penicillin-binding protein 1A
MKNNNKKSLRVKKPKRHIFITLVSFLLTMIVAAFLAGSGMTILIVSSMLEDKPVFEVDNFNNAESSKIYDINGDLIADIGLHLRENITYDQIPQVVIDAFIAIEDSRFFTHGGFDIPRFSLALFGNLRGIITGSSGFSAGGGSTITMQLVKGTYFETEDALAPVTIERKMQEIALALEADASMPKRRILELYLNRINYGVPSSRGIETAAQYYFGKSTQELSLSEAAYLAGVINAPTTFNAYNNLEQATSRRNTVLFQMRRHGYITEQEEQDAKNIPLENLLAGKTTIDGRPFQAYIDTVVKEVIVLTGKDPYNTPMNIYTYMQPVIQQQIDDIQNGNVNFEFIDDLLQVSGVVMDHTTGQVVGVMGGRDYNGERLLNRATDARQQIGSTAKGILTYPLAFEHLNISTAEVTKDEPILIAGTTFILRNFDRRYRGEMTIRSAFANSMNIPAYQYLERITQTIGARRVVDYLNSIGMNTTTSLYDLGFAFGGSNFVASPMQLNAAYGAIFNDGQYIQPHTISRIEFRDGSDPLVPQYAKTRVVSSAAAFLTMTLMNDAIYGGYPNGMTQYRRTAYVAYGKTGTTNYGPEGVQYGIPEGSAKEHWVVVGNTKYVSTVWVGFDKAVAGRNTYMTSAIIAQNYRGRIVNLLMDSVGRVQSNYPILRQPDTVVPITHILGPQPYLTPTANLNPAYIASGLVKDTGANTVSVPFPTPSNLTGFTSSSVGTTVSQTVTIQMTPYPDELATIRESETYEMELITPTQEAKATGTRLFSLSWIRGPIVYAARVVINGEAQIYVSNTPTIQIPLTNMTGSTLEVCGFYAYEYYLDQRSNVVCQNVALADPNILTVPNWVNQAVSQFRTWVQTLNLTQITYSTTQAAQPANVGKITAFNPSNIINTNMHVNDIRATPITVTFLERVVDLTPLIGQTRNYAYNTWPLRGFVNISDASSNVSGISIITDVLVNGVSTSSIETSKQKNITLVYAVPVPDPTPTP